MNIADYIHEFDCVNHHPGDCEPGGKCCIPQCRAVLCKHEEHICSYPECGDTFQICDVHDREYNTDIYSAPLCVDCTRMYYSKEQDQEKEVYKVQLCRVADLHGYDCLFTDFCEEPGCKIRLCSKTSARCDMSQCRRRIKTCDEHTGETSFNAIICRKCSEELRKFYL